jgi:hypothetical protein
MKRSIRLVTRWWRVVPVLLVLFAVAGVYLRSGQPASMKPDECHSLPASDNSGLVSAAAKSRSHANLNSPEVIKVYTATLIGASEVPPNASTGTGSVTVTVNTVANTMRIQGSFSGLLSNTAQAHIHCCAPVGTNIGIATPAPSFAGFPLGVTSGTFDSTLDLTQTSAYSPAFVTANGGTAAGARAALLAGLDALQAYFNIHTVNFPGGEIRGQLAALPLAAGVSVAGRVITSEGRGVRNARVSVIDQHGATRVVLTGPRGEFNFVDVPTGETYVVAVTSRRFSFSPQVISVNDSVSDLVFTPADGNSRDR